MGDEISDLNISTFVMMLDTNIRMDPQKLNSIYDKIIPVDYSDNKEGIIKISVRGNTKGFCKKMVNQKNRDIKTTKKKTFQNQLSFYIRIFEDKVINITDMKYDPESKLYEWEYIRGQTAFQTNAFQFDTQNDKNGKVEIVSHMFRKSIPDKVIATGVTTNQQYNMNDIQFSNKLMFRSTVPVKQMSICHVVEVNMFVFASGRIKMAGCTSDYQVHKSKDILVSSLNAVIPDEEYPSYLGISSPENFKLISSYPVMINSDFKVDFEINRYNMDVLMRNTYNIVSMYEPCTHPAVIIKYYCNTDKEMFDPSRIMRGKCQCREFYGNKMFCAGKGDATRKGGCKSVTILVFQSGKIIVTGGRVLTQVNEAYNFMKKVLTENRHEIIRT